jgi:hypothetical protein
VKLKHWALAAAVYGGLSAVCLAAPHFSIVERCVGALGSWVWLLGPPVTLIEQPDGFPFYLAGTALIAAGIWLISLSADDSPEVGVIMALILAVAWSAFGAMPYVWYW